MKLILASGSPRRQELLKKAGVPFEVVASRAQEKYTETKPGNIVMRLSSLKCEAVAALQKEPCVVLGADTIVAVDDCVLGKPKDCEDACRMLRRLQGRSHTVLTGVTLIRLDKAGCQKVKETVRKTFYESTHVYVKPMTEAEIKAYVDTGEPMDAAGAYKIQLGFGKYIERFDGDYENIIGLPVKRVLRELERIQPEKDKEKQKKR